MTGIISEINLHEGEAKPILARFSNIRIHHDEVKTIQATVYKDSKSKNVVVAAEKEGNVYTGTVSKNDESTQRDFLLIRNRKTGKIRLVAFDTAALTLNYSPENEFNAIINSSQVDATSEVNKIFGTKKMKRATEQKERRKTHLDDVEGKLEQTVAAIEIEETYGGTQQSSENDSAYRPPINREASRREQVYLLDSIVPSDVLNSLEEEAESVLNSGVSHNELCPSTKKLMEDLRLSTVSDKFQMCQLILYIDYLLKFILKPAKNITKRFVICESSTQVNSHILENYSVLGVSGRTRPLSMRDKAVCSILVLAMIASHYELDMETLAKDTKHSIKKLQEMGRILAFSSHSKNKNLMVLKLPLPPPVVGGSRKRKK